jgi:hypothetical protein
VHGDVVRQRRHVPDEAVAARDLERHERDLPRPAGWIQRAIEAADVQHVDLTRPERHRAADGDAVHDPPVEEVLSVDLDRRQDPRDCRGGQHRIGERPLREPVLGGALDARGDALERHGQLLDPPVAESIVQQRAQRVVAVQAHARARERPQAPEDRPAEQLAALDRRPRAGQPLHRGERRLCRDRRAVDRADRRAEHEVGRDAALQQGAQHADLVGAERSAAAEHECHGR